MIVSRNILPVAAVNGAGGQVGARRLIVRHQLERLYLYIALICLLKTIEKKT